MHLGILVSQLCESPLHWITYPPTFGHNSSCIYKGVSRVHADSEVYVTSKSKQ